MKGNLPELPFPAISVEINTEIEQIIDQIIISQDASLVGTLQKIIYDVFQLTKEVKAIPHNPRLTPLDVASDA